ncbi:MAG: YdeI/OmpD-associated family protein, partial [Acidobacteria bacterium]|nr:YdeI/OmpD-associated family protein [Acidobacteriota bacterium]
ALRKNRAAAVFFGALPVGQRRLYVGWIEDAKREATRTRRITEAVERMARGERLGMK